MPWKAGQQEEEEQFGYDWEDALPRMQAGPLRVAVAQYLLANLPGSIAEALSQPDLLRRDKIEWLYGETVDRIAKFTPYLPSEERALGEWKEQCPQAYTLAEQAARKAAQAYQDRSRRDRPAPATISDEARQLSLTAHLIAARKLYQHVLGLPEYYEGNPTVVGLKVPPEMQADLRNAHLRAAGHRRKGGQLPGSLTPADGGVCGHAREQPAAQPPGKGLPLDHRNRRSTKD